MKTWILTYLLKCSYQLCLSCMKTYPAQVSTLDRNANLSRSLQSTDESTKVLALFQKSVRPSNFSRTFNNVTAPGQRGTSIGPVAIAKPMMLSSF